MSIPVASGFMLKGQLPIDDRFLFETIADLKAYSQWFLPDMYMSFVKEDQSLYVYSVDNTDDPITGRWRKFEGGASSTSQRYVHEQTTRSDKWSVQHGLNEQYPSNVLCIDTNGDEIVGDIEFYSNNLLTIEFVEAVDGKCIVIK